MNDPSDNTDMALFFPGQVVLHRLFDYRGVVLDVDPVFQGTDAWYEAMARSRPPRNRPWYNVLVHEMGHRTYVAEQNLEADDSGQPVRHPDLGSRFHGFEDGRHRLKQARN